MADNEKLKVEVKESSDYDNYLGKEVDDSSLPSTLGEFMGEKGINTEVDVDVWRS